MIVMMINFTLNNSKDNEFLQNILIFVFEILNTGTSFYLKSYLWSKTINSINLTQLVKLIEFIVSIIMQYYASFAYEVL